MAPVIAATTGSSLATTGAAAVTGAAAGATLLAGSLGFFLEGQVYE